MPAKYYVLHVTYRYIRVNATSDAIEGSPE